MTTFELPRQKSLARTPVLTNEYGLAIPPPLSNCIGEECVFRRENPQCERNLHHLHSTATFYEAHGVDAAKFRLLSVLTAWMPQCQHRDYHNEHELNVDIPDYEIMVQAKYEASILGKVAINRKDLIGVAKGLMRPNIISKEVNGLKRRREDLMRAKADYLTKIKNIEVLPESLVTGALLIAAPNIARSRLMMGSDFVLTGTMTKNDIPYAISFADEVFEDISQREASLQTGVNAVELVA